MPGPLGTGSFAGPNGTLAWGPAAQFHIASLSGVDDLPGLEIADTPRPVLDGSFQGHRRLQARVIQAGFEIIGAGSTVDYDTQVQTFINAMVPSDVDGTLLLFNSSRLFKGYVSRRSVAYEAGPRGFSGPAAVEFICDDPRMYDATLQTSAPTALPTASGGFGFNFGFPFGFGGAGTGGIINVTNSGNWPAPAILTIVGPCTNPVVYNDTQGVFVKFLIALGSTDTLTVDLDQRLVTLNSTGNRNNTLTTDSRWWLLNPGANTVRFNADTGAGGAAALTMAFRSAWA